jgi:hypothetical protein
VVPVRSWFEAALVLYGAGDLSAEGVTRVRDSAGLDVDLAAAHFADVLQRGWVETSAMARLLDEVAADSVWEACAVALGRGAGPFRTPSPPGNVDYLDVLKRFGYYSTESNGHFSEYVPWYRKRTAEINKWIDLSSWINGETGGYLRVCTEGRNWFETDFPNWLKEQPPKIAPDKRSEEHGDRDVAERHAPAQHARAAEEIECCAECQRTEETAGVAQRRVDGQRRTAPARLGAAGAPRGQRRRVRPDQHRVQQDESSRARVRQRRAEADPCRQRGGGQHCGKDETAAAEVVLQIGEELIGRTEEEIAAQLHDESFLAVRIEHFHLIGIAAALRADLFQIDLALHDRRAQPPEPGVGSIGRKAAARLRRNAGVEILAEIACLVVRGVPRKEVTADESIE